MDNMCLFFDFQLSELETYYKKVNTPVTSDYAIYTGGNFVFVLNHSNKTIRFSSGEKITSEIPSATLNQWLEKIKKKYPKF